MQLRLSKPTYVLLAFAFRQHRGCRLLRPWADFHDSWSLQPEYSYGILIPALSLFLIWREREQLRGLRITGSWYGLALVAVGLALRVVGELSTMSTLQRYAFSAGSVRCRAGVDRPRHFPAPVDATGDPDFHGSAAPCFSPMAVARSAARVPRRSACGDQSGRYQRLLEGNVVDLGTYKLEVAEACSGLALPVPLDGHSPSWLPICFAGRCGSEP